MSAPSRMISKRISIHAPLRERPAAHGWPSLSVTISIHAPLRERPFQQCTFKRCALISIHAPLRERPSPVLDNHSNGHFNPRSLTGATIWSSWVLLWQMQFQSTLPYGSDRLLFSVSKQCLIFQSTLPYGSDLNISSACLQR